MIYVSVVTYTIPDLDDKRHVRHEVKAYPTQTMAEQHIDDRLLAWTGPGEKFVYGTVHTVEEVQ